MKTCVTHGDSDYYVFLTVSKQTNYFYIPKKREESEDIMSKYTTIETIKSGKMQYNVKTGKDFRDTMAKWHNADFELAEKILDKSDRVKARRTIIDSDNGLIARLEKGETIIGAKTIEDLRAEIAQYETEIQTENTQLSEYRQAQADRYAGARNLLTKELYNAYVGFLTEGKRDEYIVALANFFDENGIEPAMTSLNDFVAAVGKKKNSARQKVKTGNHNGAVSFQAWRDVFLGEICDVMGDALPIYKFTYVLKDNRRKDA